VQQLRQDLADTRMQLRRIKDAKDHELLYRDSVEEDQEKEIMRLRAQVRHTDREKRELARRLEDAGLLYPARKY